MKKLLLIVLLTTYTILDEPTVAGIVAMTPFLALAIWIAWRFMPREVLIEGYSLLKSLWMRLRRKSISPPPEIIYIAEIPKTKP